MLLPAIPPLLFLVLICCVTLAAAIVHVILRRTRIVRLRKLAHEWQMHYTPDDRFRLGPRVAERLGVPGAAGVAIEHVIYASEGDSYRYYFTATYTTGVLKRKSDHRCVCTAAEKKEREPSTQMTPLVIAPEELPLVEQYRHLRERTE